ncbi:Voltagegated ion channel, partial [Globisporangium splendens]
MKRQRRKCAADNKRETLEDIWRAFNNWIQSRFDLTFEIGYFHNWTWKRKRRAAVLNALASWSGCTNSTYVTRREIDLLIYAPASHASAFKLVNSVHYCGSWRGDRAGSSVSIREESHLPLQPAARGFLAVRRDATTTSGESRYGVPPASKNISFFDPASPVREHASAFFASEEARELSLAYVAQEYPSTTCVVPYRVCFHRDAKGAFALAESDMDAMFFIDIVLNFFTGIYLPSGEITYSSWLIVVAYLRGWFAINFFSTMPFDLLFGSNGEGDGGGGGSTTLLSTKLLRSLKVLKLFKLARIRRLGAMFTNLEDAVSTNPSLVSLVKLALSVLFFAHIVECVWYAVGLQNTGQSWILDMQYDTMDLEHKDLLKYLASVYWAIVTMATIGYGDIAARNNEERLVNTAVMAIGVSFFGYVIGTISSLVANLDVAAALYDERMTVVKEYILSRQTPKHMSKKICDHFEYYFQNRSVFKERKILKRLPLAVRNEMIHHAYAKLVSSIKYFTQCHESLISDIVMPMHLCSVLKDEYVYVQHETAMEVYDHEHGNGVRMCSAVANSFCELTFLSREAILKLSEWWPEVLKHFRESARENSKRLRRRAGASSLDDDMFVLFRDQKVATAMIRTSVLVKKSMRQLTKSLTTTTPIGRASSRISPFNGHDKDDAEEVVVQYRYFSGNFDAPQGLSLRELPLGQVEDDGDELAMSYNNAMQTQSSLRATSPYAVTGKESASDSPGFSRVQPAKGKKQVLASLAPLDALRKKPMSMSFNNLAIDRAPERKDSLLASEAKADDYLPKVDTRSALSIDGLFFLDILLNFRTAFFNDEKMLIYNASVICKKYAKGWFVPDLISTIPLATSSGRGTVRDFLKELLWYRFTLMSPWAEQLLRLMLMMSLFCHWRTSELTAPPLLGRYIVSMHWVFTTLTIVGYGDVSPNVYSVYELCLVITLIIVNATIFGYIVSSVMSLIHNFNPSDRECKLLMNEMKDYLRDSSVSARLCANAQVIFDKLALNLRFDIARLVATETLFAIPLITVMEDALKGFVSYALFLLKPICIVQSEKVCRSGGPGTEMFFLVDGECDLVNSHTGKGRIVSENAVFEQYALMAKPEEIYRTISTATAITKKCILYSFTIQDFKALEDVSPAVSAYFLSQLAAVLIEDDLYELSPVQKANVDCALRKGQMFRSVAEHHHCTQLNSLGKVALAKLYPRRGSEWSPDLLPRQLKLLENEAKKAVAQNVSATATPLATARAADHEQQRASFTQVTKSRVRVVSRLCDLTAAMSLQKDVPRLAKESDMVI